MGSNPVKKPKTKGKNRLRLGTSYPSVAICKTWDKGWRTCYKIGVRSNRPGAVQE